MSDNTSDLTTLLQQWRAGDVDAASRILREVYMDLRKVAGGYMRRHLLDHARRNRALKRGAGVHETDFDEGVDSPADADAREGEQDLEHLDRALEALGRDHPRAAQVGNLRFFGGESIDEVATTLGISPGTVKRDFEFAKAYLPVSIEDGS